MPETEQATLIGISEVAEDLCRQAPAMPRETVTTRRAVLIDRNGESSCDGEEMKNGPTEDTISSLMLRYAVGDWIACFLLLSIGLYFDKQPPFEQYIGNRIHDPSISYPHTPGDQQRVTGKQLYIVALWLPLGTILLTHCIPPRGGQKELNRALLGLFSSLGLALTIVCIVKINVGRLRPDFLARCLPIGVECSRNGPDVTEGRKSFPSGHTCMAMAGLAYLSLCLHAKLTQLHCPVAGTLWKLMVAGIPWFLALWVGLSRIQDYWHHWEDVLVGGLIGNITAFSMFRLHHPCATFCTESLFGKAVGHSSAKPRRSFSELQDVIEPACV